MGAFTFVMGLTLAVAGIFLFRNYAQFLRGAYAKPARVVSIQQVFSSCSHLPSDITRFVKNGFYPVVEYYSKGESVRFTAIDQGVSGNFHVGDELKLRVIKTGRSKNRMCKTGCVLVSLLMFLALSIGGAALASSTDDLLGPIFSASFIIAICLAILVFYMKDQDERCVHNLSTTKNGRTQLFLVEPAAYKNWTTALTDPVQRYKIRSTQFIGMACLGTAMVMLATAIEPIAQPLLHSF